MLGSASEAEDAGQKSFQRMHQTLQRDDEIASLQAYIGSDVDNMRQHLVAAARHLVQERRPRHRALSAAAAHGAVVVALPAFSSAAGTSTGWADVVEFISDAYDARLYDGDGTEVRMPGYRAVRPVIRT